MLYNPIWETKAKPSVFSLEGLISWLEKQDPLTSYNYSDGADCLLSRYFRASGYRGAVCMPIQFRYSRWFLPALFSKPFPREMNLVALHGASNYGAALERARVRVNGHERWSDPYLAERLEQGAAVH